MPPEYRSRQYVVEDWGHHHLHRPPRGYQWVQVGGGYVLVTIGSGVVAQIMLP
ncbi:MAG: RcnB family protein [Burkholderiaceae bacterium]